MYIAVGKTWDRTQFVLSADILDDLRDTIDSHFSNPDAVRYEQYEVWQIVPATQTIAPMVTLVCIGSSYKTYVIWHMIQEQVPIPHLGVRQEPL